MLSDASRTRSFIAAPSALCGPSIEYQVSYTPTSATTDLITLPSPTVASIVFAKSTNVEDAKVYVVTINATEVGSDDSDNLFSPATATYTYFNPCLSTYLTAPTLIDMTTSVL